MKILNLYAGVGGNRAKWEDVDVTAVERNEQIAAVYQRLYPEDTVIVGDAHDYLLNNFSEYDFIWTSPPCQSHSSMNISGKNRTPRYPDMKLYEEIIFLKQYFKKPWVVENVKPYYEPLIPYQAIGRHCFWSNFNIHSIEEPTIENFIMGTNVAAKNKLMDWLGIHYEENIYYDGNHCPAQVLRNCVHPTVGLAVLNFARGIKVQDSKQLNLLEGE